jgi:alpha-mannosidase
LLFASQNLAKGNGNWFTYYQISDLAITISAGDVLHYEVYLDPKCPVAKGGVDCEFTDGGAGFRDLRAVDQNGIRSHSDGQIPQAVGKWYTRHIPMDAARGRTTRSWTLVFEGDPDGRYVQFVDNIYVSHKDGSRTLIYENAQPNAKLLLSASGYTRKPLCTTVDRSKIRDGADVEPLIAETLTSAERIWAIEEVREDIKVVEEFVAQNPGAHLEDHVAEAKSLLDKVEQSTEAGAEELQQALHAAKRALSHTHPVMEKYTGHLVGHAHIDLQWLWEWQEGIVCARDTFAQAVRFMDEFPGFTFSQSSSCLYQTIEEHYPDLFKQIQQKVKKGQWEIVGGRVCEGDLNMISPESHARHFLYGQSYFREKFGKKAVVGWEPDTFGHSLQMPQILKLGGCDYYYFCRGGKGKPLFWWEGLDGTKILTFDEPASGSWYNSDLSYHQFKEILDFERRLGGRDMLWVYGVGNHGGGPTRELINEALKWMKAGYLPNVKFSTATQFFKKLEQYDLTKIPVINQELNPVFDGCYTTHSEVKQLNRDAEAMTTSAEAVATVASLYGFPYPQARFRRNWEDICFNHHHDTLPGSGIHPPYEKTKISLGRVLAEDKDIIMRALESLSVRITPPKGGISILVFNPTGWTRSGWVETFLVQSGWDPDDRLDPEHCVAKTPDGKISPVILMDKASRRVRFWASDIPPFGYRVIHLTKGDAAVGVVAARDDGFTLENDKLIVEFDRVNGCVKRLYDKEHKREVVAPGGGLGRLEAHYENPGGMTAWVIQKIDRVIPIKAVASTSKQTDGAAEISFNYNLDAENNPDHPTTIRQTFRLEAGSRQIICYVDCDWTQIGSSRTQNPMLRAAFDADFKSPVATYEIPFGALSRPLDNQEYPALKWADIADPEYGLSVLNDCKHGYSASANTLRLTLIRSSYEPDPVPNPGLHHWKYVIYPHAQSWAEARTVQVATELNQILLAATVPFDAQGANPLEFSPLQFSDASLIPTSLKRAESNSDLVVRFYQGTGSKSEATMSIGIPAKKVRVVNFLEDDLGPAQLTDGRVPLSLRGFEIKSLRIHW